MARIVSVSYDEPLLFTRELILRGHHHEVRSALGFADAMELCATADQNLLVLGHSIPKDDKIQIIQCFRKANPSGQVIILIRAGEERLPSALVDTYVYPGNPEDLVRAIDTIASPSADRRSGIRRVK